MEQPHNAFVETKGSWHHLGWRVLDARTYWVTRLTADGGQARRRTGSISKAIRTLAEGPVWEQGPTLYVFKSYATIDYIAWCLRSLRRVKDTILIGSFTHQECRILGPCRDPHIFDLVSFARSTISRPSPKPEGEPGGFRDEEAFYDFLRSLTGEADADRAADGFSAAAPSKVLVGDHGDG
jgi:hypothetical protein